jgi:hypothetical protein
VAETGERRFSHSGRMVARRPNIIFFSWESGGIGNMDLFVEREEVHNLCSDTIQVPVILGFFSRRTMAGV